MAQSGSARQTPRMHRDVGFPALPGLLLLLALGCSNEHGSCEVDCAAYADCARISDCAAWCDTGIGLADPACAAERRTASACQAQASCTSSECSADIELLSSCVAARSPDGYQAWCRDRAARGCPDANCSETGIALSYAARGTGCTASWNAYVACLRDGDACGADLRCLTQAGAALACRSAWCSTHTTAPELCTGT